MNTRALADPQIVDLLHRCAALAADQGVTIPTDQWIDHGFGAGRTIKLRARIFMGHHPI